MASAKDYRRVLILLSVIGAFYALTLREGHDWGDDFSMFIRHAQNIAEGRRYMETGYIVNPYYPAFCPRAYPPIYPVLLAPIYKWFGLNLAAMKIENILFFISALGVFYLLFEKYLSPNKNLLVTVLVALNPSLWAFKDNVLADWCFLLFLAFSFWLIQALYSAESKKLETWLACATGIALYLTCGTRPLGVTLLASLFLYDMIRHKSLTRRSLIPIILCVGGVTVQYLLLGTDSRFKTDFQSTLSSCYHNVIWYAEAFGSLWKNGRSKALAAILAVILSGFSIRGYWIRLKQEFTIYAVFPWVYLAVIVGYPWNGDLRLIIPLIPFYMFYLVSGLWSGEGRGLADARRLLLALMALSYLGEYSQMSLHPLDGATSPDANAMYRYVRDHSEKNDVFVFWKPRAFALFTNRRATPYSPYTYGDEVWDFYRSAQVAYLVEDKIWDRPKYSDFVNRYKNKLDLVFSNPHFNVWKIRAF